MATPIFPNDGAYTDWDGEFRAHQIDANTWLFLRALPGVLDSEKNWQAFKHFNNGVDQYITWGISPYGTGRGTNEFCFIADNWQSITFSK